MKGLLDVQSRLSAIGFRRVENVEGFLTTLPGQGNWNKRSVEVHPLYNSKLLLMAWKITQQRPQLYVRSRLVDTAT
jgi:hypothetical protein